MSNNYPVEPIMDWVRGKVIDWGQDYGTDANDGMLKTAEGVQAAMTQFIEDLKADTAREEAENGIR